MGPRGGAVLLAREQLAPRFHVPNASRAVVRVASHEPLPVRAYGRHPGLRVYLANLATCVHVPHDRFRFAPLRYDLLLYDAGRVAAVEQGDEIGGLSPFGGRDHRLAEQRPRGRVPLLDLGWADVSGLDGQNAPAVGAVDDRPRRAGVRQTEDFRAASDVPNLDKIVIPRAGEPTAVGAECYGRNARTGRSELAAGGLRRNGEAFLSPRPSIAASPTWRRRQAAFDRRD